METQNLSLHMAHLTKEYFGQRGHCSEKFRFDTTCISTKPNGTTTSDILGHRSVSSFSSAMFRVEVLVIRHSLQEDSL